MVNYKKKSFWVSATDAEMLLSAAAVIQLYETDVGKEYAIVGNDAIMKCQVSIFHNTLFSL